MAAGITLRKDALGAFRAYLEERAGAAVEAARREDALLIDGAFTAGGGIAALSRHIARAGPFGAGNPEPVIALPAHTARLCRGGRPGPCARAPAGRRRRTINAIAFRAAGQKLGQRCWTAAGARSTRPARWRSTAGRARSACSSA